MDIQIDFATSKIWLIIGDKRTEIEWTGTLWELRCQYFKDRW